MKGKILIRCSGIVISLAFALIMLWGINGVANAADSATVTNMAELQSALQGCQNGTVSTIELANDIDVTTNLLLDAPGTITIDGNGHKLIDKIPDSQLGSPMLTMTHYALNAVMKDITIDGNSKPQLLIKIWSSARSLTMDDGFVMENSGTAGQAAQYPFYAQTANPNVVPLTVTLKSGAVIKDNYGTYTGGLCTAGAVELHVYGKLTNNSSISTGKHYGAAINVWNSTVVLHKGCELSGNKSYYNNSSGAGGAISISTSNSGGYGIPYVGKLIMYGGTIKNNYADYITGGSTDKVTHAENAGGGGVAVTRGVFVMYGGAITGNSASYGGGINVNNNGSLGDWAGYFIGLGGTVSGNTCWGKSMDMGDTDMPITANDANVSTSQLGKAVVASTLAGAGSRVGLVNKADIDVDAVSLPAGTNLEVRNAHETNVSADKSEEAALNNAFAALSQSGKELAGFSQIDFHAADKTAYAAGRETRWFMGLVNTDSFKALSADTEENVNKIYGYMNELDSNAAHNTANCLPWSKASGNTTVKITYPGFVKSDKIYRILYVPYDKAYGTAEEAKVITPAVDADGLTFTVAGGCRGAFEAVQAKGYSAGYNFVSGTADRNIPSEITSLLPASELYLNGTVVKPAAPAKTSVDADGGTWEFAGYDASSKTINSEDINFTGTWKYKANNIPDNIKDSNTNCTLVAKGAAKGTKKIKFSWIKVKGATKYVVYASRCSSHNKTRHLKKAKIISGSKSTWTIGKLKKHTSYKYKVYAFNSSNRLMAKSYTVHVNSSGTRGKYGNTKKVRISKKLLKVKTGKAIKIRSKAKIKYYQVGNKKCISKAHAAKYRYVSSNKSVASVSASGKISGIAKGTCKVYVQSPNGVWKTIRIAVN